mgnify:CR=1 FL=1
MAYIITSDGTKTNLYRIAENDFAKNNLYLSPQDVAHTISDSEFNNLKNNTKVISSHDGTNYIYEDTDIVWDEESSLTSHLSLVSKTISSALKRYPGNPDASSWTTYKNFIDNFDTSTITFPLNNGWEKYCEDNSIFYINILQLP